MSIPDMSAECSAKARPTSRVLAYIDGFNVYYGLRNASRDSDRSHLSWGGDPSECLGRSLYWLDLEAVVLSQLKRSEECVGIKYFSAPRRVPRLAEETDKSRHEESNSRQSILLDALSTRPHIELVMGWYSEGQPHRCSECGHQWPNFEEKVTDVNIATHLITDAYEGRFDRAFLITADADLVPPVKAVRALGKDVAVGLFPGRKRAKHLREAATEVRMIKMKGLRNKRLPDSIERGGDLPPLVCPERWSAPNGWVWSDEAPSPASATN